MKQVLIAMLFAAAACAAQPAPQGSPPIDPAYDPGAPVILRGKVVDVVWADPVVLKMEVTEAGIVRRWDIQGGTRSALRRNGLLRSDLLGETLIIRGYQSRDRLCEPACRAQGLYVTFADGRLPNRMGAGERSDASEK